MESEKELPKRKLTRLKNYDYSSSGVYFVTICTRDRQPILSEIIAHPVGEGLAPPESVPLEYTTELKPCGKIAKEQIMLLEVGYRGVTVTDYVIMPDHIHMIIQLKKTVDPSAPSPTLSDIICAFKSLTSRQCKQRYGIEKMFQRSFAEHIVRDKEDYEIRRKYVHENPMKWYYKTK